ncbi:MAG: hypothetical protein JRE57_00245 [Deltaproteobacteria bacterium]|nr:hypothetical protein [Deltaproteobacteria bacterium]
MPDGDKDPNGVKKPSFDPSDLLSKLKGIVSNNTSPGGVGKSWLSTIVIIAVVLAGFAAWSWFNRRHVRELARLRHEKNKARILAANAKTIQMLADGDEKIAAADRAFAAAREALRVIAADERAEEGRYEADLRAIDSIGSWRDAGVR